MRQTRIVTETTVRSLMIKIRDEKARCAHDYANAFVVESGEEVRQDDVVPLLVPALEVFDDFRDHLAAQKLTQKYWYTYFAELIVDRLWRELTDQEGGA